MKDADQHAKHQAVLEGYRVESQGERQAVMVKGKRINHVVHFLFSWTGWLFVWILFILVSLLRGTGLTGVSRRLIQVTDAGIVSQRDA